MSQARVNELAKAGYWLGGTPVDPHACTCSKPVIVDQHGEVHLMRCPQWKAEWRRRDNARDLTR